MSLSSFLLKSAGSVDPELDALFKDQPQPSVPITSSTRHSEPEVQSKKRKLAEQSVQHPKRHKSDPKPLPKKPKPDDSHEDEENSDLEAAYLRSREPEEDEPVTGDENDEGGDDGDDSNLMHESLAGKSKSRSKSKKEKYVPPDEEPAQRDQRTIFIGNLSLEVAQKRPLQKQLQRHILSFVPTAKVESIRFRSVPFSAPTTTTNTPTDQSHKNPSQREHDRTRASSWRSSEITPNTTDATTYLTQNQKKKILFLTHQFHSSGTTIHAYIVFAHPPPLSSIPRPTNLPPLPDTMNPYEAAKQAVTSADGTKFEGRIIRVDFVGKNAKGKAREEGEEDVVGGNKAFEDADPKCTLFVGSLDLGAKEEDLRAFFESLMKSERGEPPEIADAEETTRKSKTWVTHVRIIRDKETQLGKGFGYVQFADRECVDELLTLQSTQLKFAKRKLRIQRCKTLPGTKLPSSIKSSLKILPSSSSTTTTNTRSSAPKNSKDSKPQHQRTAPTQQTPIIIPKGDPSLCTRLASMSKQERKAAKAADADRVARRLAKKKARMTMGTKKNLDSGGGLDEKRRVRAGKGAGNSGKDGVKGKKVRVRSEKSLEKRNMKK